MKKKSLSDHFFFAAGRILFVIVSLNVLSLLFELIQLGNFENYNLTFKHGYFILNDEQVGINMFANLFALIILAIIFTLYSAQKQKTLEQSS